MHLSSNQLKLTLVRVGKIKNFHVISSRPNKFSNQLSSFILNSYVPFIRTGTLCVHIIYLVYHLSKIKPEINYGMQNNVECTLSIFVI